MDRRVNPVAVILYGPPASGKDTITAELTRLDSRYAPFQRLKIGSGKTDGYRLASPAHLAQLHADNAVLYQNQRYGNTYVVDELHLAAMLATGQTPIIHLGQLAGVRAVTRHPARWIAVLLWCARQTTAERARARGSADLDARLAAWDETLEDLQQATDADFFGRIDTDSTTPDAAAKMIHSWAVSDRLPIDPSRRTTA
jgi:guanylate kinase